MHNLLQTNQASVCYACVRSANKLPTVVVGIMGYQKNRLATIQYLPHRERGAIPRLVERPGLCRVRILAHVNIRNVQSQRLPCSLPNRNWNIAAVWINPNNRHCL
jgi:hypothetical protein